MTVTVAVIVAVTSCAIMWMKIGRFHGYKRGKTGPTKEKWGKVQKYGKMGKVRRILQHSHGTTPKAHHLTFARKANSAAAGEVAVMSEGRGTRG